METWKDKLEEDLREKGWHREGALDRDKWRRKIHENKADPK